MAKREGGAGAAGAAHVVGGWAGGEGWGGVGGGLFAFVADVTGWSGGHS